ncbi:MAG TPA: hypothetical protein VHO68_11225 [Bacteroidales bacterium]|nr:hypothetical protein [Bacteroidales bacterium]
MFVKLLVISIIFLILTAIGFGIRIILKGKFPETHVSGNEEMAKRGLTCAEHTDIGCNSADNYPGCASCSRRVF